MRINRPSIKIEANYPLEISEALFAFNWGVIEHDSNLLEGPQEMPGKPENHFQ
jgi:hypothetical protein